MTLLSGHVKCPVCTWPADPPVCVHCHWNLEIGQQGGGELPTELKQRLEAARYKLDMTAAKLAAGGNTAVLTRLLRSCRGKPWDTAPGREQRSDEIARGSPPPDSDLIELLGSLAAGDLVKQLVFADVGLDALTWRVVRATRGHAPTVEREAVLPWMSLAGTRVADSALLAFHLAGGVGMTPTISPPALYELLAKELPPLDRDNRTVVAVIRPNDQWMVLTALAWKLFSDAKYATWAPQIFAADIEGGLAGLVRYTPLPNDYGLTLLTPGADGVLLPTTRRLFAAGSIAGVDPLVASIEAVVPSERDRDVTLAVVVAEGGPPELWTPVTLLRAALPVGRQRVRLLLEGLGRVRLDGFPAVEDTRSWTELLKLLPTRAPVAELDVVVAVEICDDDAAGTNRLNVASEIVNAMATAKGIRVAVLTFGQHRRVRAYEEKNPVRKMDFDSPSRIRELVAALASAPGTVLVSNSDDYCVAAEEMLGVAAGLSWRSEARRALISIGRRPPYPLGPGFDSAARCPDGIDWKAEAVLITRQHTIMVAVRQPHAWKWLRSTDDELTRRYDAYWATVGANGLFDLDRFQLSDLAAPLGLPHLGALGALPFPLAVDGGD